MEKLVTSLEVNGYIYLSGLKVNPDRYIYPFTSSGLEVNRLSPDTVLCTCRPTAYVIHLRMLTYFDGPSGLGLAK